MLFSSFILDSKAADKHYSVEIDAISIVILFCNRTMLRQSWQRQYIYCDKTIYSQHPLQHFDQVNNQKELSKEGVQVKQSIEDMKFLIFQTVSLTNCLFKFDRRRSRKNVSPGRYCRPFQIWI